MLHRLKVIRILNPTRGRGALKAHPEEKSCLGNLLVIKLTPKKFGFSQISMAMPPVLLLLYQVKRVALTESYSNS